MDDGSKVATTDNGPSVLTSGDFFAAADPLALFGDWLAEATETEPNDPNAMSLATVDPDGMPDLRMVLLKGYDSDGFVFYTNLESRKGEQLAATPKAALCFHWKSLRRQVRVRGGVSPVSTADADAYFVTRARVSRLGAWASRQSRPLADRRTLEQAVAELDRRTGTGDIPRPPHWSGFRVAPEQIEFWKDGAFRLHDRLRFSRSEQGAWERTRLYP